MKNLIRDLGTWKVTAFPYTVVAGAGVLMGSRFGVAVNDTTSGATGVVYTEGVFTLAKTTGQAWTEGQLLYWDDTAKKVTSALAAGANKLIGCADKAAASGDTTGDVQVAGQVGPDPGSAT